MFRTPWLHVILTILVVSATLGTSTVTAQDATPTEAKSFARKIRYWRPRRSS